MKASHVSKPRRAKKRIQSSVVWLLGGALGSILLIVAALAFTSRGENQPGQTVFDPDFEPQVTGGPRVEVVQDEVLDYGKVKLNTVVNTVYTVRNVGDEPLVILGEPRIEVVEGCCPPRAVVSSMVINPGHEGRISMSYSMHEGMGGPHEFRVHLKTNDAVEPTKYLTIYSDWVS